VDRVTTAPALRPRSCLHPAAECSRHRVDGYTRHAEADRTLHRGWKRGVGRAPAPMRDSRRAIHSPIGVVACPLPTGLPCGVLHTRRIRIDGGRVGRPPCARPSKPRCLPAIDASIGIRIRIRQRLEAMPPGRPPVQQIVARRHHETLCRWPICWPGYSHATGPRAHRSRSTTLLLRERSIIG
jgi:hypothetical protein